MPINGMAMSRGLLVSQTLSCKEQLMAAEGEEIRESVGKITSENGRV